MAEQGIIKIEGKYYYFDYETYEMRTGGWINPVNDILGREDEHWIYADSNGVLYSGWKQINNYTGAGSGFRNRITSAMKMMILICAQVPRRLTERFISLLITV